MKFSRRIFFFLGGNFLFSIALLFAQVVPDFSADGLGSLSEEEIEKLFQEEIVVPEKPLLFEDGKTMVTAALIIRQPVDVVWRLLTRTEDQEKYLPEVRRASLISRTDTEDRVLFEVKILHVNIRYTVTHRFFPQIRAIIWTLDPTAYNDLKEFQGFWRLYPYGEAKTVARYGSRLTPRFKLAAWVIQALYARRVRTSLVTVKKYLDSGGKI